MQNAVYICAMIGGGIFVIPNESYPPVKDANYLNCGECLLHCPACIMPNMMAPGVWIRFVRKDEGIRNQRLL